MAAKQLSWIDRILGRTPTKTSAEVAAERLTVLLMADEKSNLSKQLNPEKLNNMKLEVAQVVGKYVSGVQSNDVSVEQSKEDNADIIKLSISLADVRG